MSRNFELMTQIESEFDAAHNRIRTATDLAVVKAVSKDAGNTGGEAMFRMVQSMFLSTNGRASRQIVFCGVDSENGSSSVCANAAKTLAAATSGSVCLVDANFRSQRLSGLFGVDRTVAFLRKSASVRERCYEISGNLWLAGRDFLTDENGALPSATRLKQLVAELHEAFEFVLIDAPGAGNSGDAAILGQMADGIVLVIEAGTTRRIAARKAKESLDAASVRILGTILHSRTFPIPEGLYRRL